ncbi:MAG TPA: hypothetical protein VH854_00130, partial [Thermoanaerobaculia bacterium]|nr:hypothetical protein [Thermoanaerobaculia bacterium]
MTSRLTGPRAVRSLLVLATVALATILVPASGSGQVLTSLLGRADAVGPGQSPQIPEFGTASESVLVIGAETFQLVEGTENLVDTFNSGRSCGAVGVQGVCAWLATVNLPSGAL